MSPLVTTSAGLGAEAFGFTRASAASGAYEQIATTVLTSTSSTITFASLPTTYKHLELRITARVNANIQNTTTIRYRFNGEGGLATGYSWHNLYANGSSVVTDNTLNQSGIQTPGFSETSVTGNWGVGLTQILDYNLTSKTKVLRSLAGAANASFYNRIYLTSGLWNNTNAITQIELTEPNGYGWVAGSRFTLYGIKG
jgi:hypothetical protein